ncbi:hypothetical protein ACHAWC_003877 [Mediolabrus comicus]
MWGCIAVGLFAEPNYGTAKSGVGRNLSELGAQPPLGFFDPLGHISSLTTVQDGVLGIYGTVARNIIPVVQAGVLGIYGLIVAVIIQGSIVAPQNQNGLNQYSLYTGFAHLASDLSGLAVGIVGDAGVRAVGQQEQEIFIGMILILIFAEALGLYGLIVALILS